MAKDAAAAVKRWKRGHELATARQRDLLALEGARPAQAVAEALSAAAAVSSERDAVSELAVEQVRRRWAKIQHRAKQAYTRRR